MGKSVHVVVRNVNNYADHQRVDRRNTQGMEQGASWIQAKTSLTVTSLALTVG